MHPLFGLSVLVIQVILGSCRAIRSVSYTHLDVYKRQEQARVISDISGSQRLRTENLRGWARLYSAKQQPEQAIQAFESCLQIAQERNAKPVIQECLRGLAQLYEQQGQPAQALHYLKIYGDLKDAATRERVDMRIEALEEAHRVSLLQQEHAAVQQENILLEQIVQERNHSLSIQQQLLDRIAELSTPCLLYTSRCV